MTKAPRPMTAAEIDRVLQSDVPAHLATVDRYGFPHVTAAQETQRARSADERIVICLRPDHLVAVASV